MNSRIKANKMKKTLLCAVMTLGVSFALQAQNTFPANGDAGVQDADIVIGNTNPNQIDSGSIIFNEYPLGNVNQSGAKIGYDGNANVLSISTNNETTGTEHIKAYRNSHLLLQPTSGNVGIGTTTLPTYYKLDVHGETNSMIRAYAPNIARLSLQNSSRHYSTSVQNSKWFFFDETAGQLRMTINEVGKIGIGTSNPSHKLQIHDSDTPTIGIGQEAAATNGKSVLQFNSGISSSLWNTFKIQYTKDGTSDRLSFVDGGNVEGLSILNGGKIGVGTSTPSEKLDVVGGAISINDDTNGLPFKLWSGGSGTSNQLRIGTDYGHYGDAAMEIYQDYQGGAEQHPGKVVVNGTLSAGSAYPSPSTRAFFHNKKMETELSKNAAMSVLETYAPDNSTIISYDKGSYSAVTRMAIPANSTDNGYKIGIDASAYSAYDDFKGTLASNRGIWARAGIYAATPGAKVINAIAVNAEVLDNVVGATITNAYGVKISTNGYNQATVTNRYDLYAGTAAAKNYFAGKVGLGITAPNERLEVGHDGDAKIRLYTSGTDKVSGINFSGARPGGGASSHYIGTEGEGSYHLAIQADENMYFKTNADTHMTLTTMGNFGVGTTNPLAKMQISDGGTAGDTSLQINDKVKFRGDGVMNWGSAADYGVLSWDGNKTIVGAMANKELSLLAGGSEKMIIKTDGKVGIGTATTGSHRLAVEGSIGAREIMVEAPGTGWSDFVFENDYNLPTLQEVEKHIQEKGHLKDIPSAADVEKNGFYLGEMDAKLLQKIEELTLYIIQQQKEIEVLKKKVKS